MANQTASCKSINKFYFLPLREIAISPCPYFYCLKFILDGSDRFHINDLFLKKVADTERTFCR
jgi:hypothetical protein